MSKGKFVLIQFVNNQNDLKILHRLKGLQFGVGVKELSKGM